MSKLFGFRPQTATQKLIEKFEDEVLVRVNNQQLLGTVYVDMAENRWAVAFAYNYSRNPGLHGHENALEACYSMTPGKGTVKVFRSDSGTEKTLAVQSFSGCDSFVSFVLAQERIQVMGVA